LVKVVVNYSSLVQKLSFPHPENTSKTHALAF